MKSALIASPFISVQTANELLSLGCYQTHHLQQVDPCLYQELKTDAVRPWHLDDLVTRFLDIARLYSVVVLPIGSHAFQWQLAQAWPNHETQVIFTTRPEPVPVDIWDGHCEAVRLALPVKTPTPVG